MANPFRFSVQSIRFGDEEAVIDLARTAEELGYHELFTADHVGAADPMVPLIAAAGATTKLRFGPLVLNNELHHPVLLARTVATADRFSGGRMTLGMGTGYMQSEHDATGIELRKPGPRVERLEESLLVLRSLLDRGSASHHGTHHTIEIESLGVRPLQEAVPFLIGGHGPRVVGIAGRHADIFQFTGLTHGPDGTATPGGFDIDSVRQRSRWLTDAAGDRSIERSALVQATAIGDGADEQIEAMAERIGADRSLIEETPFLLMGSEEQVIDKVERLRADLGISHFVIRDVEDFAPIVDALG